MTTDLTDQAGLTVELEPATGRLRLGEDLVSEESAVRDMAAAHEVYACCQPESSQVSDGSSPVSDGRSQMSDGRSQLSSDSASLYYMENGLRPASESDPDRRLRYELTSLRPGTAGPESVKTMGHVHAPVVWGLGQPELYEVLFGHAAFPLFRPAGGSGGWECVIVEAQAGERFVIPPGWHHLAVNVGEQAMVFADIVARDVVPDYTVPRKLVGGPVRFAPGRVGRNAHYGTLGSLARVRARELPMPHYLDSGLLWPQYAGAPADFEYLLQPASAAETWRAFDELVAAASPTPLGALEEIG